jgi:hypothetical protein
MPREFGVGREAERRELLGQPERVLEVGHLGRLLVRRLCIRCIAFVWLSTEYEKNLLLISSHE